MSIVPFINRPAPLPLDAAIALLGNEPEGAAFDFLNMRAWIRDRDTPANTFLGDPNDILSYTSPSTKRILNASGVLEAGNTLRTEYGAAGNPLGLLIEGQRTNLLLWSEAFDNATWPKSGTAVTADQDGVADLLVPTASTGMHFFRSSSIAVSPSTTYTLQIKAKKAGYRYFYFGQLGGPTAARVFDFDTGTYGTSTGTATYTAELQPDGFWLLSMTFTTGVAVSSITLEGASQPTTGFTTFTGDGVSGALIKEAQLEAGSFLSSYIKTEGSQVTRAEDNISMATADLPYSAPAGVLILEAHTAAGSGTQVLWQSDDGSESERLRIVRDPSNAIRFIVTDGGVEQSNLNLGTVANGTAFKAAVSWAANDFAGCLNGGSVQTDTSGTLPTVTTMRAGRGFAADSWFGHIKTARHLPRNRVNNAELQGLSS